MNGYFYWSGVVINGIFVLTIVFSLVVGILDKIREEKEWKRINMESQDKGDDAE